MREHKRRAQARRAATARRRARTAGRQPLQRQGTRRRPPKRVAEARARHPASNTPPKKRPLSPRVKRRRGVLLTIFGALAFVGFLFAFVYPTSTFLRQRSEMGAAEQRIARIDAETRRLGEENSRLLTDAEVERLAREQYGLVRPGETPYALVPSAPATTVPPATAPSPLGQVHTQP
jgi:cell division protein FtsB